MYKVGQVVYSVSRGHTIKVESVKAFEGTGIVILKGTRLKKDGTPYKRNVHNLLTHLDAYPLQIVSQ